jgi:hypothetical protein
MLRLKIIPFLNEWQWIFITQRLDKPAPQHMRERLKRAIANTNEISGSNVLFKLNGSDVSVSLLKSSDELIGFECEKGECSDFIQNPEGLIQRREKNLDVTYVFRSAGTPIGFITIAMSSLRKLEESRQSSEIQEIPSLLLTHLARDIRYKGKGVGKLLTDWVIYFANELAGIVGCRFVILEIEQKMITLFQRYGFELLPPDRNNRRYVMFFDLGIHE